MTKKTDDGFPKEFPNLSHLIKFEMPIRYESKENLCSHESDGYTYCNFPESIIHKMCNKCGILYR